MEHESLEVIIGGDIWDDSLVPLVYSSLLKTTASNISLQEFTIFKICYCVV